MPGNRPHTRWECVHPVRMSKPGTQPRVRRGSKLGSPSLYKQATGQATEVPMNFEQINAFRAVDGLAQPRDGASRSLAESVVPRCAGGVWWHLCLWLQETGDLAQDAYLDSEYFEIENRNQGHGRLCSQTNLGFSYWVTMGNHLTLWASVYVSIKWNDYSAHLMPYWGLDTLYYIPVFSAYHRAAVLSWGPFGPPRDVWQS